MVLFLMACTGSKDGQKVSESDSLMQQGLQMECEEATLPTNLIEGMEESDMPEAGLKAWIDENGEVYWNVYDVERYQQATGTAPEFYRIGDGPQHLHGLEEFPVGVCLARLNSKGDVALYIITHRRHVCAFDISLEVSQVGGGVGMIEGVEDVAAIRTEGTDVVAVDSKGAQQKLEFYAGEGPYQCEVVHGETSYAFEFSSTWNMRLVVNAEDYYAGRFRRGENGYYTFTLNRHYRYDKNYKESAVPMTPVAGSFRLNVKKGTVMFDDELAGLPAGKALPYEVFPLFD